MYRFLLIFSVGCARQCGTIDNPEYRDARKEDALTCIAHCNELGCGAWVDAFHVTYQGGCVCTCDSQVQE